MASETHTPATVSDNAAVGSVAWTCANGDLDDNDGIESSVSLGSGTQSHYLQAIGCGFAIPSDATIDGILVSVLRRVANGSGGSYPAVRDTVVKLTHGGSVVGTNQADTGTDWPASELEADYGGMADTWGAGLAVSQLNHSSFGVVISSSATGGVSPDTAYVDRVVITVYYTVPDPLPSTGAEYAEHDLPDEPAWFECAAAGIAGDDYNAPPSIDAVTLAAPDATQFEDADFVEATSYADASSASMLDGLADAMIGAFAALDEAFAELVASGVELVGAAWLSDGPICDCAGIAVLVRAGYGTAIVRGFGAAAGESATFGTATIRGGYGTAKIIISCQC